MTNSPSTLLVTGGAGFIGSALVRQWLEHESASIVNLDNFTYAGLQASLEEVIDHPRHRLVVGDIADPSLVTRVLAEHAPKAIIHLAAESHVDRSIDSPPAFAVTNVVGTCVLLDAAVRYWRTLTGQPRDAFRFLLVSTDEVFGSAQADRPFTATSPLAPNSPYAATKAAAELLARAFRKTYELPLLVVNPSNNYGPRQLPEKLIPKMILAAAADVPLTLYGDGLHQRDWLHVDDCCRALRLVLDQGEPGSRYLIGADHCQTNLHVAEMICDLVDELLTTGQAETDRLPAPAGNSRRRLIRHIEDRPGHDRRYAVDPRPLREELGWSPQIPFAKGLRDTVRWYLENRSWTRQAQEAVQQADS